MFEIHPCKVESIDESGHQDMVQCDPRSKKIACWGLYRVVDGLLEWIEDYPTRQAAKGAHALLEKEIREKIPA